jgi:hypothetical protein
LAARPLTGFPAVRFSSEASLPGSLRHPPVSFARQGANTSAMGDVASAPAAAGSAIAFDDALAPRYGSDLLSLKPFFVLAAGRPPFLVLPGSGGFAEFASSARSASPVSPLRTPFAKPESCGGVGPPGSWETRWFAVTTAPVLRARRSLQGRYFLADLTSPAAVS